MNFLKNWPIFGPFLALLLGLLQSPQGHAFTENTYCDLYVTSEVAQTDKTDLSRLGYRPVASPHLKFSIWSLRAHTDKGAWVLDRSGKSDRLYFELDDGLGNVPIMNFTLRAKALPKCEDMKKSVEDLSDRRRLALKAVKYLRGDHTVSLFEAVLDLEQLELRKRGAAIKTNFHFLNPLKASAHQAWVSHANESFFPRLNAVRQSLLRNSLKRYCRELTTMSEMSVRGCTNCVGQTATLVSLYHDMRIQPPVPWQLGFMLYDDHMQPVLYDMAENHVLDLLTNKVSLNKSRNPVLAPDELLRMGLRKHRELILPFDKIEIDRIEYLSSEDMLDFFSASNESEPDVTAANARTRIDAFSFKGIRTRGQFSIQPSPAAADLSGLIEQDYRIAGDVRRSTRDELRQAANGQSPVPAGKDKSEASSPFRRPSDYPAHSFAALAIQQLIPAERSLYQGFVASNLVPALLGERFDVRQVHPSLAGQSGTIMVPFTIAVDSELSGVAPFRIHQVNGAIELSVPTDALASELQGLPLLRRYHRLIEIGRQYLNGTIRQDVDEIADVLESRSALDEILRNSATLRGRLERIRASVSGWGIDSLSVWPAVFDREALQPQALRLNAAARALARSWGRDSRGFMKVAGKWSEDQIQSFTLFFAQLSVSRLAYLMPGGNHSELAYLWESLTRPLMLSVLYDKKFLWTGPRTPQEIQQRETLDARHIPVEDVNTMDLPGPKVNLPPLGKCEEGDYGWMQNGSFVWRCPDPPSKRVVVKLDNQSVTVNLRHPREVPAALIAGLILLNHKLFLHPGHFLLLHEMWSDSVERAHGSHLISLFTGAPALLHLGREISTEWSAVWRVAPMLLSEKLPMGAGPFDARDFLAYTQGPRSVPDWISFHTNYALAYSNYRARPRKEVAKRQLSFSSSRIEDPWAPVVSLPGGAGQTAIAVTDFDILSGFNPSYALGKLSRSQRIDLDLEARFGRRKIFVQIVEDGRSVLAAPRQAPPNSGASCTHYRNVEMADEEVWEDSLEGPC